MVLALLALLHHVFCTLTFFANIISFDMKKTVMLFLFYIYFVRNHVDAHSCVYLLVSIVVDVAGF